jgi:diguanylate cyclase
MSLSIHSKQSPAVTDEASEAARLEEEARSAVADLQAVLNSVPAHIGYWDTQWRNRFANVPYARWFGKTPDEMRGMSAFELTDPEFLARIRPFAEAAFAGQAQTIEEDAPDPGGGTRRVSISYIPDRRHGKVHGVVVMVTDVSTRHQADLALQQSEGRYRSLFENMQTGFALHEIITDPQGRPIDYTFLACNPSYTSMTGLKPEVILGRTVREILPGTEVDPADWIGVFGRVALTGESIHLENYSEVIGKWYDVIAYCPAPRLFAVLIHDVTERKRIAAELATQHEQLRVTLRSIGDGVITTNDQGAVEYMNPVAERLTGWSLEDAHGRPVAEVYHVIDETTREALQDPLWGLRSAGEAAGQRTSHEPPEHRVLVARDDHEYSVVDSAAPIRDDRERFLGAVVVFHDVTLQRALAREMSYRATHDALTQLPNRTEFEHRLTRELSVAHQSGLAHALLYIDLDQFKIVNDACGHAIGDRLLQQIAEILRRCVRAGDTLARLGGDEFGVILSYCDADHAMGIAQTMCDQIEAFRFVHEAHRFRVGASIGVVPLDRRWPTTAAVLQAADVACYAAKEAGRNRVHAYADPEGLAQERRGEMMWAARLQEAIEESRFILYCQRIEPLRAEEGGVHIEILLRMRDEGGSVIAPGAFIPAAERYQLAGRVDRWVLMEVLRWMRLHSDFVRTIDTVAINLSGQSIGDRSFHRFAEEAMRESSVDVRKLCFEVTETATISNLTDATQFFEAMRAHGCRFSLDDFGSGLSSFAYLKLLPVDYLKIDGQFVRGACNDALDRATVRCIHEVAHVVGKRTIAECAESAQVCKLLRDMGVDYAQGYAIHRPEPLEDFLASSAKKN